MERVRGIVQSPSRSMDSIRAMTGSSSGRRPNSSHSTGNRGFDHRPGFPFESAGQTGYDGVGGNRCKMVQAPDEACAVDTEFALLVTYACPRCGVTLESYSDDWRDWRKCPSCGKAGRPPVDRRMQVSVHEDILYIGTFATGPGSSNGNGSFGAYPAGQQRDSSHTKRVILGGGFFLAVVLALVSAVQQNGTQAGVLGVVAVFLLILLARSSGRG
jgi:hypothetical protein